MSILALAFAKAPSKEEFSEAFIRVAEKVNPAVVSIISEKTITQEMPNFFFHPRSEGFDGFDFKGESLGSGVIIDARKGYIVTNNHVVEDAQEIRILLLDDRELDATVIATDPLSDLALLQVEAEGLTKVEFGDSDQLSIGEWVMAIGSPFGINLNHTVTAGIVSAKGRSDVISRGNFENFIQHDAAINQGNSGGALLNLDGKLVGINTAIATGGYSTGNAGVGFAIPVNQVKRVIEDLMENGHVSRGWLGVSIQDIDKNMAKALGLKNPKGAIIAGVLDDSPASQSDIQEQDIITEVNGTQISDASGLKNLVASGRPDEKMKFKVIRDGKEKTITVKLGERPDESNLRNTHAVSDRFDILGLKVEDIDRINTERFGLTVDSGVIITEIKKDSPASGANVRVGEVITKVGQKRINTAADYTASVSEYESGDSVLLLLKRDGGSRFVALELE